MTDQIHGMKPAVWAYRGALRASVTLEERREILLMLAEELLLLNQQISHLNLMLSDWELPKIASSNYSDSLQVGLSMCKRLEELKDQIRKESYGYAWPWRAYCVDHFFETGD